MKEHKWGGEVTYVRCECGATFSTEQALDAHLEAGGPDYSTDGRELPRTRVDRAAEAAMTAIEGAVGEHLRHALIIIDCERLPDGEMNATVAGHGYEDTRELIAELLDHASKIGEEIGYDVHVIPAHARGQG